MPKVTFTWPHSSGGYGCKTPGDLSGDYYPAAEYEAVVAKLKALLIALEVREIDDLMAKTYEYFSKLGEVIKDNIVERDIKIMTLRENYEAVVAELERVKKSSCDIKELKKIVTERDRLFEIAYPDGPAADAAIPCSRFVEVRNERDRLKAALEFVWDRIEQAIAAAEDVLK